MKLTEFEKQIERVIAPILEDMGYALVQLDFTSGTLLIMAENKETGKLGVDECAALSRAISPALEVEDLIKGAYRLEISSPGIDRPLVRREDFQKYSGLEAKIEINPPREDGRKRFRGIIQGERDGFITLQTEEGDVSLPYAAVHKAKLVLTDALIEQTKNKRA